MSDMMKIYAGFLGDWELEPESCVYEQSAPPRTGSYSISEGRDGLTFDMAWTDAEGENHEYGFAAMPDGKPHAFPGGDLADALSVTALSQTELNSAAFYKGRELMTATRTLVDEGAFMEVRQSVLLPDGTRPVNFARYRRKLNA
jgi:hypothetical protein